MGSDKVYKTLQEIFPQIDPRALRAVAIEHSNDVDAAVVAVLDEVIPLFLKCLTPSSAMCRSMSVGDSSEGAVVGTQTEDGNGNPFHNAIERTNEPFNDTYDGNTEEEDDTDELTLLKRTREIRMSADMYSQSEPVVVTDQNRVNLRIEVVGNPEAEETNSGDMLKGANQMMNLIQERDDAAGHLATVSNGEIHRENSFAVTKDHVDETASLSDVTIRPVESSANLVQVPDVDERNLQKLDVSLSTDPDSSQKTRIENADNEDASTLNVSMSQSSQFHIVGVVEEVIADARNNKKTLFLAMESVISLMRQVEDKEKAVEQAKEEAAVGGSNILDKVEEIKCMLQHAKEANDMHAGEVYGEKAILATELRELQFRVLSLSIERDKSLAVLDEMSQTLEMRLAAAEKEIKRAEQEKLEKEKAARKSLFDQELIMEKVVQESKILKQQAEDNAKFQEFLVDRGRVVDMLQGEIAVICQDVRLLKEKFDDCVPFSQSLSSNQTSFILASSNSSSKSPNPDEEVETRPEEDDLWETQTKRDRDEVSEEEAARDDRNALINDGWEFCEDREIDS